ncbi:MAG: hypothetical protein IKK75_02300 [Clostridia bacterium]|nr:hypothetical protein [Clostridia bacterium]
MKKWIALLLAALMLFSSSALAQNTLPVYRATFRSQTESAFFELVKPEWFNQSCEPAYENGSRSGRYDIFTFGDQAQLTVDQNYISYQEFDGEYYMIYGEDPQNPGGPFQRPSFSNEIALTAGAMLFRFQSHTDSGVRPVLLQQELSGITLAQADAQVQELLDNMGLTGYELTTAIDMSVNRICEWGVWSVESDKFNYNVYDRYYDFTSATEADEGYYLVYTLMLDGVPAGNPDGTEDVCAFVNADGVARFELRSSYAVGDVYSVPDRLLTEDEIRAVFESDNERRIADHMFDPAFTRATLMYCPMRAPEKKDGMVMTPAWYIEYTYLDGSPTTGWVWYSAVDGKLIMDCYS